MREITAIIEVDDERAIELDMGTGEYLEREFGWLSQSGIRLREWLINDSDDEWAWARYMNYLIDWVMSHYEDYDREGQSPLSYQEWLKI